MWRNIEISHHWPCGLREQHHLIRWTMNSSHHGPHICYGIIVNAYSNESVKICTNSVRTKSLGSFPVGVRLLGSKNYPSTWSISNPRAEKLTLIGNWKPDDQATNQRRRHCLHLSRSGFVAWQSTKFSSREGRSCMYFWAIAQWRTRNLALKNPVQHEECWAFRVATWQIRRQYVARSPSYSLDFKISSTSFEKIVLTNCLRPT